MPALTTDVQMGVFAVLEDVFSTPVLVLAASRVQPVVKVTFRTNIKMGIFMQMFIDRPVLF